jgi:hypothetical protein
MSKEFRLKLCYEIDDNFKLLKYSYRKMNKNKVKDVLMNEKQLDDNCYIYICDLLNINCIVIYSVKDYYLIYEYDANRKTILLLKKEGIYYPILKTDNHNYIDLDKYDKIKKVYNIKNIFTNTKQSKPKVKENKPNLNHLITKYNPKVYQEGDTLDKDKIYVSCKNDNKLIYVEKQKLEEINTKEDISKEIETIKKLKVNDLREIAKNYRVDILDNQNKKKSKKELVEEIMKTLE